MTIRPVRIVYDSQPPRLNQFSGLAAMEAEDEVLSRVKSLYVSRPLLNTDEFISWAKANGFSTTLTSEQLHITLAYSRTEVDWSRLEPDTTTLRVPAVSEKSERSVERFQDATVLRFADQRLSDRWQAIRDAGATSNFPEFKPHVTISYQGAEADLGTIEPFLGELVFGPEVWAETQENWSDNIVEKFQRSGEVFKVDAAHGVVFGFAIVCKNDGKEYFDLHGDHIPEDSMLKATVEFMESARVAKDMHGQTGDDSTKGSIVFGFPLTTEICKALGITTKRTGFLIGMKPNDPAMLAKFASGEYTGFSIGGSRIKDVDG